MKVQSRPLGNSDSFAELHSCNLYITYAQIGLQKFGIICSFLSKLYNLSLFQPVC